MSRESVRRTVREQCLTELRQRGREGYKMHNIHESTMTSRSIGVAYSTEPSQSRILTNLPPPYTWTGARAGELRYIKALASPPNTHSQLTFAAPTRRTSPRRQHSSLAPNSPPSASIPRCSSRNRHTFAPRSPARSSKARRNPSHSTM